MRYEPYAFQRYCMGQIVERPCIALWLDMGLGKTAITLSAIAELKYDFFAVNKVLVVAPKKVAEATWQKEAAKWDHTEKLRFSTVLGSATSRVRALCTPADVYVINRDNIKWLVDYYRNDWPFDVVILDEASSFKNHRSQRWKALKLVRPRIKRVIELTGTPSPHGLEDLWAQIYLLDQGTRLGKTITGFRERFLLPDKRDAYRVFSYKAKDDAEEKVFHLLSDLCISMSAEDYLDLPDLIYDTVPVELDSASRKAYMQFEREALLQIDDETLDAGTAAVLTNKLLQFSNGAVYNEQHQAIKVHDCKLDAFMELIEAIDGQPALVFYAFQSDADRIMEAVAATGKRVRIYRSAQDEEDWNSGEIDLLLAHPASCGYGLNLQQGGHHVIWFGLNWSLELFQQANKRLHRKGQPFPVIVHLLIVQGSVEEDVIRVLEERNETQNALLTSLKARIKKVREGDK